MKRMILNLLLIGFPALIFAQQSPQEQLKTEMKRFQEDLQNQLKSLQDSVAKLRSELNERDHERMKGWDWSFHYDVPEGSFMEPQVPEMPPLPEIHHLDDLLNQEFGDERNWGLGFETPPAPCIPPAPPAPSWNFEMPHLDNGWFHVEPRDWHFDLRVPEPLMRKHRPHYEDILESLPFYRLFKS